MHTTRAQRKQTQHLAEIARDKKQQQISKAEAWSDVKKKNAEFLKSKSMSNTANQSLVKSAFGLFSVAQKFWEELYLSGFF